MHTPVCHKYIYTFKFVHTWKPCSSVCCIKPESLICLQAHGCNIAFLCASITCFLTLIIKLSFRSKGCSILHVMRIMILTTARKELPWSWSKYLTFRYFCGQHTWQAVRATRIPMPLKASECLQYQYATKHCTCASRWLLV